MLIRGQRCVNMADNYSFNINTKLLKVVELAVEMEVPNTAVMVCTKILMIHVNNAKVLCRKKFIFYGVVYS